MTEKLLAWHYATITQPLYGKISMLKIVLFQNIQKIKFLFEKNFLLYILSSLKPYAQVNFSHRPSSINFLHFDIFLKNHSAIIIY